MSQHDLFGHAGDASAPAHRLFFALWPDAGVRERIAGRAAALRATHAPDGRALNPARYHLTLPFLGDFRPFPEGIAAGALAAGDAVQASAFELVLDRAGGFANSRVWWLGPAQTPPQLQSLWEALHRTLATQGLRAVASHTLVPHVTVQRDVRTPLAPVAIDPVAWPVRGFALIDSAPPQPYRILRQWPLVDG